MTSASIKRPCPTEEWAWHVRRWEENKAYFGPSRKETLEREAACVVQALRRVCSMESYTVWSQDRLEKLETVELLAASARETLEAWLQIVETKESPLPREGLEYA